MNRRTNVVSLSVLEGEDKPYTLRGKAYKRSGTASIEVDRLAYNRLVLEGEGKAFEELPSRAQDLHFETLSRYFSEKLEISDMGSDF